MAPGVRLTYILVHGDTSLISLQRIVLHHRNSITKWSDCILSKEAVVGLKVFFARGPRRVGDVGNKRVRLVSPENLLLRRDLRLGLPVGNIFTLIAEVVSNSLVDELEVKRRKVGPRLLHCG